MYPVHMLYSIYAVWLLAIALVGFGKPRLSYVSEQVITLQVLPAGG